MHIRDLHLDKKYKNTSFLCNEGDKVGRGEGIEPPARAPVKLASKLMTPSVPLGRLVEKLHPVCWTELIGGIPYTTSTRF